MLGDSIKRISIDPSLVEWIKQALKASHHEEAKFHKAAVDDLRRQMTRLENRLSQIYIDKIDGVISDEEWKQLHARFLAELDDIKRRLDSHTRANLEYYEQGAVILELAQDAYTQYLAQNDSEKRKLLEFVLSNCLVKGAEFVPVYRQPFDLLAVYNRAKTKKDGNPGENHRPINFGVPKGIRTPVTAVKGRCPRPG